MLATVANMKTTETNAISFGMSGQLSAPASGANERVFDSLMTRACVMRLDRDETVFAQDDQASWCYLVVSGCVRTVQLMEDGRRQVGEFYFAGDLFGWDALDRHDFSAEAVSAVTLRRISRRDLDAIADRDSAVSRRLRELSARRLRSGREHLVLLGRKTASERIASFLLEMSERISRDGTSRIDLPMNRSDMGDYLGLTIETVCRRLTQLRHDGTITVKGATISIRDLQALGSSDSNRVVH